MWDEGGPVSQGPVGGGRRGGAEWVRKYNLDGDMVRASGGEGGIPCLTKGEQRGGSKGKSKGRESARATKWEASVDAGLVEVAKGQL